MSEFYDFEDDLEFVSNKVASALNIFCDVGVKNNMLVTMYGADEFIALIATPKEESESWCKLRLRTKDMAATWDRVPLGFSKINESRGLLSDMKRAAHVSLKRNSVWYLDKQLKDVVGDRVALTELTTNKGYLYKISFTNGYSIYLSITKDDKEYYKPHDLAALYVIAKKNKEPISSPMTLDECILMLINIAMQNDIRVAEFISVAERCGGKTLITNSYRTQDASFDEAKAVFSNGYALKLQIVNGQIIVEALGRYDKKTYSLDTRTFEKIEEVCNAVKEFASLEKFTPET